MGAEFDWSNGGNYIRTTCEPMEMVEMNMRESLNNLMKKIDKALIDENEIIFNKLSKQYKYLSMEM